MMEEQLSLAVEEKSKAVAEVEQRMTAETVKQQVNFCECDYEFYINDNCSSTSLIKTFEFIILGISP